MSRRTNAALVAALRRVANFESAAFDNIYPDARDPLPSGEDQATEFIVRRTRLYRETWLAPLLDEIERRLCRKGRS